MILAIDTSGGQTMIALIKEGKAEAEKRWEAGRRLSLELLPELTKLVRNWTDLKGVVIFAGPGSFTGLRIGFTTANAIAYSLGIPIASASGDNWIFEAAAKLAKTKPGQYVHPQYGAPARITLPKAK